MVVHKQNSTIHFLTPLWRHILRDWLVIYLIVLGAMLLTDYLRYQINLRNTQQITSVDTYNVLLASSIVGAISSLAERGLFKAATSKPARFRGVLVAVIVTSAVMVGFRSDASIQQIVVFSLLSLLIGAVVILLPPTLVERGKEVTVIDQLKRLAKHRSLLRIMVQYRIASRYSQTLLGILWIILLPLTTSIILSFVFSVIMRPLDIGNAPFISFLLAGMTFWTFFNQGLSQSAWAIVRSMGLINQVYFPREILVLAQLGETLIDLVFMFTAMVIINLFVGILPSVWFVCIPLLLLVQIAFMLGIMFFLSYLSVYIRDISQLVGIALQLLFYLTPVLYPVSAVPESFRVLLLINPIYPLIEAYRSIIVYQKPPILIDLYYPIVMAGIMLYVGYCFFKGNEKRVSDFV